MAWWGEDDYLALISNMAKLRANMLAIVAYSGPILWQGPRSAVSSNGSVAGEVTDGSGFLRWGGPRAAQTHWGSGLLFANDTACAKPRWLCPDFPALGTAGAVPVDWGRFYNKIFRFARSLGLQTALAAQVRGSAVLHGNNSAVVDNFAGTLTRLQRLGDPPDYFMLWTGEGWEWQNVSTHQELAQNGSMVASSKVSSATADFTSLAQANAQLTKRFTLATGGWVLGPSDNFSFWDRTLDDSYRAIGTQVGLIGTRPLWPAYRNVTRHESWVGPWLEDDSMLVGTQIWASRMAQNIKEGFQLGTRGHLGTHWRTKPLSPNIHALLASSLSVNRSVDSIWTQWCRAEFGAEAAADACKAFRVLDSNHCDRIMAVDLQKTSACPGYPYARPDCLRPAAWDFTWLNQSAGKGRSLWSTGPEASVSAIQASDKQCAYRLLYDHWLDPFCALSNRSSANMTAAQRDRLEYWCSSFRYMRSLAAVDCAWYQHRQATAKLAGAPNGSRAAVARATALPSRVALAANLSAAVGLLLSAVSSVGEIGMLAHILSGAAPMILGNATEVQLLESALGHPLPAEALPQPQFSGEARIFVPSLRPVAASGARFEVVAVVLSQRPPEKVWLRFRQLHASNQTWGAAVPMFAVEHGGPQVFAAGFSVPEDDFEWMVETSADGRELKFPAAAPQSGQQVAIFDPPRLK